MVKKSVEWGEGRLFHCLQVAFDDLGVEWGRDEPVMELARPAGHGVRVHARITGAAVAVGCYNTEHRGLGEGEG